MEHKCAVCNAEIQVSATMDTLSLACLCRSLEANMAEVLTAILVLGIGKMQRHAAFSDKIH